MRLFVAVDLDAATRERIEALLADLRREVPEVRWARAEAIHLTLKFLGDVEPSRVEAMARAVDRATALAGDPFAAELKGIGAFGERRRPRVVWLGLTDPASRLASAAAAFERVFEEEGFPREDRPWKPHLTLARPKVSPANLSQVIVARSALSLGTTEIRSVVLFQSTLHPAGAEYTPLHEALLHAPGGSAR